MSKIILAVSILVSLSACSNLASGRFEDVIRDKEREISDLSKASTDQLNDLCAAYAGVKRYSKLFACLDQYEQNIARGDNKLYPGGIDVSHIPPIARAQALVELGDYDGALAQVRRLEGTRLGGSIGRWTGIQLVPYILALKGDRAEARRALYAMGPEPTPESDEPAQVMRRVAFARIYTALGEYEKALPLWKRVNNNNERTLSGFLGDLDTVYLPQRFMLNKCLLETGHVEQARKGYDALLQNPKVAQNGDIYWPILFDRGRIEATQGNLSGAIEFWKRAIEVIEQQRSTINTEANKIGFVGDKQQVYHRLVAALIDDGKPAQAFEYVERAKARALVDLLATKREFSATGVPHQQVAALVKDWDQIQEDSRTPAASSEESSRRSARGVQIRANIRTVSPELLSLVMVTETASSTIEALLEPEETLLEYYYQGDDLYAFVVARGRVHGVKLNGASLISEIETFRKALKDPRSNEVEELSRNLYVRLLQPIAGQLISNRLLIVGHGALHYLPFAALSDGTSYLVDRYSLRLLPSASILQFLKGRQAQKAGSLLAFGNPDLNDAKYDLKFAQDEVQMIAKSFSSAKILLRKEATKSAFKTLGPQFSYLHLATHGKFDPDAPLRSGLLLAKDSEDDGFLSMGDLYSMRLNADLVTLSACETGLGKVSNGDDVVGLIRGFLYAGSNSIAASLWEVDDLATSKFMTDFYTNLKQGDKREALRQAQLTLKKQYPHPFYWAAFQLTGMP